MTIARVTSFDKENLCFTSVLNPRRFTFFPCLRLSHLLQSRESCCHVKWGVRKSCKSLCLLFCFAILLIPTSRGSLLIAKSPRVLLPLTNDRQIFEKLLSSDIFCNDDFYCVSWLALIRAVEFTSTNRISQILSLLSFNLRLPLLENPSVATEIRVYAPALRSNVSQSLVDRSLACLARD